MGLGLENALSEITLVLFTTLAPSGIVACLVLGALLLSPKLGDERRAALNKFLAVPVLVALVGLVASATHLGNPANALYVLTGVGRSPLSNEVLTGVVFFGLVGSYWFYSFSQVRHVALERVWVVLFMLAGVVFLVGIALAYRVNTIVTWDEPLVPVNLVLNAFVGGPLLAVCACVAAGCFARERVLRACVVAAGIALIANAGGYVAQGEATMGLANAVVSVEQLAPGYVVSVGAFVALCAAGIAIDAVALFGRGKLTLPVAALSALFALCGIFVMRFMFYMLHMTVGVSF